MPQAQHPAVAFIFILFLIWLVFPEGEYQSQSQAFSDLVSERLSRYRHAHKVLNESRWGDFAPRRAEEADGETGSARYLNLTGFREADGFAWEDLGRFRDRGLQLSQHAVPPVDGQWLWEVAQGEALWGDVSGTLLGEWVRLPGQANRTYDSYNLTQSVPSMEWVGLDGSWARNMTGGASGRMLVRLEGNKTVASREQLPTDQAPLSGGLIRTVRAAVTMEDGRGTGPSWEMRLWGVHWPRQGVVLLTTTSEKFEGIFGLPHLTPGPDFYQSSQWLLDQSLARVLADREREMDTAYADQSMPWNSDVETPLYTTSPAPHCEFIMYAQIHPPSRDSFRPRAKGETTAEMMSAIEAELASPQGAPIHAVPKLRMSAVLYSPDCAFFIESRGPPGYPPGEGDHLAGMKTEMHLRQIKKWLLVYAAVVFGQVFLLKNQMKETFTPSTLGRVSFETVSVMTVVDGMTFTAAATWVSSAAATFLPTLALMFAAFLSMTIGGSLLAKIYEVQTPARRGAGAGSSPSTPEATVLPAPVTAGRGPSATTTGQTPSPGISDDGASAVPGAAAAATRPPVAVSGRGLPTFQSIIGRFILFSLCASFVAVSSMTWYASVRGWFMNLCALAYLSLWTPQIHRNAMRNCRRALEWRFVTGQSALRLLPLAYFWLKPDNFLYARTDPVAFAALAAWVWLQILVLAVQDAVGPRFGIPAGWTPDAWDYHPVLRQDAVEAGGLPIGLVAAATAEETRERRPSGGEDHPFLPRHQGKTGPHAIDCSICREVLQVPVVGAGDEELGVASVFARRMYMVTPCRHIFHTACLEGWMRFRLQCPICREELPPL